MGPAIEEGKGAIIMIFFESVKGYGSLINIAVESIWCNGFGNRLETGRL